MISLYHQVQAAYRDALEAVRQNFQEGYESAKLDVKQAEGRMVTRYDSMKTEMAWVANSFRAHSLSVESDLKHLFQPDNINVGDCVKVYTRRPGQAPQAEHLWIADNQPTPAEHRPIKANSPEALSLLGQPLGKWVEVTDTNGTWTMEIIACTKPTTASNVVAVDTLVLVVDALEEEAWYYITAGLGGMVLQINDLEVAVISTKTPLAGLLLGHSLGDNITLQHLRIQGLYTHAIPE